MEGFSAEPAEDVWAGIEAGLNRRARGRVIRRAAGITAAAASCLVAGLLVFNNGGETAVPLNPGDAVAVADPVQAAPESPAAGEIADPVPVPARMPVKRAAKAVTSAPIAEQIGNLADAYASNNVPIEDEVTVSEPETPETRVATPVVKEETGAPVTASVDWNAIMAEDDERSASPFGTPVLAISSNITSNSSSGGFSPDFGPGRSPSREGSQAASGLPVLLALPVPELPEPLPIR